VTLLASLIPAWFCVPVAALLVAIVALHMRSTARSDHPPSRKRIRFANGILILVNLPLLTAGFSLINPNAHPKPWVLVWVAAMALLACNVGLAILDVVNTLRLTRRESPRRPLVAGPPGAGAPQADDSTDVTRHGR